MSRRTAADVIALGDYLQDGFEAKSLTIPQLLGVLNFHEIKFPSQHNKGTLVQIFNDNIQPNAANLRQQRDQIANKSPNGKEIRDGVTGKYINREVVRRSASSSSFCVCLIPLTGCSCTAVVASRFGNSSRGDS